MALLLAAVLGLLGVPAGNAAPGGGGQEYVRWFTTDFAPGFWPEGPYDPGMYYGERVYRDQTDPFDFPWTGTYTVSAAAPMYSGYVVIRVSRVIADVTNSGGTACESITTINPDQLTRIVVGEGTDPTISRQDLQYVSYSVTPHDPTGDDLTAAPIALTPHKVVKMTKTSDCAFTVP